MLAESTGSTELYGFLNFYLQVLSVDGDNIGRAVIQVQYGPNCTWVCVCVCGGGGRSMSLDHIIIVIIVEETSA